MKIESGEIQDLSNVKIVTNESYIQASNHLANGQNAQAGKKLIEALESGLRNPFLYLRLTEEYLKVGNYSKANELNQKTLEILNSDKIEVVFQNEIQLIGNNRNDIIANAYTHKATLHLVNKELKEAKVSISKALELHSKERNGIARDISGRIAIEEGEFEQAISIYRSLIVDAPKHVLAKFYLGKALVKNGKHDEGSTILKQFVGITPPIHPLAKEANQILQTLSNDKASK